MSKTWFVWRALVALIIIGLLVGGGWAIYRTGWSQGYMTGQLAAAAEEAVVIPYPPYAFGYPGRPVVLGGLGLLVLFGLLVLPLLVIGKMARLHAGRMAGGPGKMADWPKEGPPPWIRHWHRDRGRRPPWCWDWEEPADAQTKETGPDAQTTEAGA
jgi:hypothetical protein